MEPPPSKGPNNFIVFEPDDPVQHLGTYLIPNMYNQADLDLIVSQLLDYFNNKNISVSMKMGSELSLIANTDVLPYKTFKSIFLDKKV